MSLRLLVGASLLLGLGLGGFRGQTAEAFPAFKRQFDAKIEFVKGLSFPQPVTTIQYFNMYQPHPTEYRVDTSVDSRRWDPSWILGFPFGHLPSDRPGVPIVLFQMPELGTMLRSPAPSLRLEALVEQSCPACYKCPSTPLSRWS